MKHGKFRFTDIEKKEIQRSGGTSEYLTNCNYSGSCLDRMELIEKEYDYFLKPAKLGLISNFWYKNATLSDKVTKIGNSSANGFILKITYKKDEIPIDCLLKCSRIDIANRRFPDNLFYEYYCGKKAINHLIKVGYTCFVSTYHLYKFKDEEVFDYFSNFKPNSIKPRRLTAKCDMKTLLCKRKSIISGNFISSDDLYENIDNLPEKESDDFRKNLCSEYGLYAMLIQNIKGISFSDFIADFEISSDDKMFLDLITILMQIYFNLYDLIGYFTHHDLHSDNILLIRAPPGSIYEFKFRGDTYKSKYLVKFIDYGRCSFRNIPGAINSDIIAGKYFPNDNKKIDECGLNMINVSLIKNPSVIKNYPEIAQFIGGVNDVSDNLTFIRIMSMINYTNRSNKYYNSLTNASLRNIFDTIFRRAEFIGITVSNNKIYVGLLYTWTIHKIAYTLQQKLTTTDMLYNTFYNGYNIIKTY